MSLLLTLFIIGLGGAAGALSRYALGELSRVWTRLPGWGAIMVANIAGCLILGGAFAWFGAHLPLAVQGSAELEDLELLRAMLLTGFCGSLTTFSTFSLDTVMLWYEGRPIAAVSNVLLSAAAGIAGIAIGALA